MRPSRKALQERAEHAERQFDLLVQALANNAEEAKRREAVIKTLVARVQETTLSQEQAKYGPLMWSPETAAFTATKSSE